MRPARVGKQRKKEFVPGQPDGARPRGLHLGRAASPLRAPGGRRRSGAGLGPAFQLDPNDARNRRDLAHDLIARLPSQLIPDEGHDAVFHLDRSRPHRELALQDGRRVSGDVRVLGRRGRGGACQNENHPNENESHERARQQILAADSPHTATPHFLETAAIKGIEDSFHHQVTRQTILTYRRTISDMS